ncbi:putative membrane protein [Pedobacter sp. AK013]|uniref:TMEM175 family protein n=1 Tax=Pedobacter sp. AK013 TaxID=2723071 RepID=UPI0016079342|nr:TMEM175 family protein [Pedobacter sp. AK013]MBB6237931.1 putative membrane protein [Pedobacter sp. AK013]
MNYNKIAGQNIQRIDAISDGVFAVAMTLLVLDIKVPIADAIRTEAELAEAFFALMPKFLVYFLSFMTVGIFWTGQSTQSKYIERSNRKLNWITLLFLLFVSLLPFSTAFLSEHITFKFAVGIYWLNILLLGVTLYINWRYAYKNNFVTIADDQKESVDSAISKRIIIAQTLYAAGAMFCFISPYLSIGIIIAIQINYAFGIISNRKEKK